jgi:kinesin family protein C2/C3
LGDKPFLANRRAEVIDWLGGLLPEFDLPLDSSDEELREYLIDGTALCYIAEKLMPGIQEVSSLSSGSLN